MPLPLIKSCFSAATHLPGNNVINIECCDWDKNAITFCSLKLWHFGESVKNNNNSNKLVSTIFWGGQQVKSKKKRTSWVKNTSYYHPLCLVQPPKVTIGFLSEAHFPNSLWQRTTLKLTSRDLKASLKSICKFSLS